MADVFAPQPVKTKVAGDVVVNINTGQTVGLSAGAAKVGIVTTDQTTHGTTDLIAADITKVNGSTVAVGHGVAATALRVELPTDGTGVVIANNPTAANLNATVVQSTGTNLHVVVDSGTIATTGGGVVGTVADNYNTSVAVAAGATVTLDSTSVPSGTGHLTEATVSSSVALKAQLGTWNGTVFTVKRTFFVPSNTAFSYFPSRSDQINLPTAATATYRWSITNNDNANAADVYASTTYYYI